MKRTIYTVIYAVIIAVAAFFSGMALGKKSGREKCWREKEIYELVYKIENLHNHCQPIKDDDYINPDREWMMPDDDWIMH